MTKCYEMQYGLTAKVKIKTENGELDLRIFGYLIDVKSGKVTYLLQELKDKEIVPMHVFQSYLIGLVTPTKVYYHEHAIYLMSLAEEDREIEQVLSVEEKEEFYTAIYHLAEEREVDKHVVLQYSPFFYLEFVVEDGKVLSATDIRTDCAIFRPVEVRGLLNATVLVGKEKHVVSDVVAVKNENGLFVYAVLDGATTALDDSCMPNLKAMINLEKLAVLKRGEDCTVYCTANETVSSIGSSDAVVLFFDDKSRCCAYSVAESYDLVGDTEVFEFNARFSIVQ